MRGRRPAGKKAKEGVVMAHVRKKGVTREGSGTEGKMPKKNV